MRWIKAIADYEEPCPVMINANTIVSVAPMDGAKKTCINFSGIDPLYIKTPYEVFVSLLEALP